MFNDAKFDDELGNNDEVGTEAVQLVPVHNDVGDGDDMQPEKPVVNDVVQRPIVRVTTDDSEAAEETIDVARSASTLTVLADVHAMPVALTIDQDVIYSPSQSPASHNEQ